MNDLRTKSIVCLTASVAFALGALFDRHDIFPFPALRAAKSLIIFTPKETPIRFAFDKIGRVVSDDQKTAVPCPQQTDRTAVLLLLGQSNAGNHGGQRFELEHGNKVVNFFNGQCFIAASPLLGSDGIQGEYWTVLGNLLIESGAFDQVVLAPATLGGSTVSRWAPGGDLNPVMIDTVSELQRRNYAVTQTLWDQGEIDYVIGTSEAAYTRSFTLLVDSLRKVQVLSLIYLAVASKCLWKSSGGLSFFSPNNPVARAQSALPDLMKGVRAGVNTDALLDEFDRYDDCHFGSSGAQKVAKAWARLLVGDRPKAGP